MIFTLHCDLSYDGTSNIKGVTHIPRTFVFAGIFADSKTWEIVENKWLGINDKYGVRRFHAAHLNAKSHEYSGWDDAKKVCYSSDLLAVMRAEGKRLHAVSCGIFADEYRRIISEEGRRKMGSPYLVCFNSCITLVAKMMDAPSAFPPQDCFSVILDEDVGYLDAIESFMQMKQNPQFPYRSRLGTINASTIDRTICIQTADLAAYEIFKRLNSARDGGKSIRHPLKSMMRDNVVDERYFGTDALTNLRQDIEVTASVRDGGLVIIPKS